MIKMKNISKHFQVQTLLIVLYSACTYCVATDMEGYKYEINEEPISFVPNNDLDEVTTYKLDAIVHNVLDVALVFDSSYTITTTGWFRIKKAAKQLVDGLDISPQGTHVSIMKYSTDVETFRIFEQNADKEKLKREIDEMSYDGEWSRLDLAVKAVDEHVFAAYGGARLGDVPKAVILFTDGKADGPTQPDEDVDWQLKVLQAVQSLKMKGVIVYAVSVGGFADQSALEAITGSASDFEDEPKASSGRIFDLDSIGDLTKSLKELSTKIPSASVATVTPTTTTTQTESVTVTATMTPSPSSPSSSLSPSISTSLPSVAASSSNSSSVPETSVSLAPSSVSPSVSSEASSSLDPTTVSPTLSSEASSSLAPSISPSPSISTSALSNEPISTIQPVVTSTVITTVVLTTTVQVTETVAAPESKQTAAIRLTVDRIPKIITEKRQKRSADATHHWYHKYIPRFIKRWISV